MGNAAVFLSKTEMNSALRAVLQDSLSAAREELKIPAAKQLRLLVAVSGGMDSCVLLSALSELRQELNLELSVAHFDHRLRPSSEREAEFVAGLAAQYGFEFSTAAAPPKPAQENLEAWARNVRYEFLEHARRERAADLIATAHHSDDQAETVLFRLLSGRLLTDARSIAALNLERKLIRPLLAVSKAEVTGYAESHCLPYVMDESNFDLDRTRNSLRHELIPQLEADFNPQIVSTLSEFGERLSADEKFLWSAAAEVFARDENISAAAPALRWRLIRLSAEKQIGEAAKYLGYAALKRVESALNGGACGPFDLGFGITYRIDAERHLIFGAKERCLSPTHLLD